MGNPARILFATIIFAFIVASALMGGSPARAADSTKPTAPQSAGPITAGLRVFTCGHSFHATVIPQLLAEIAESANIKDHVIVGVSMIGASQAIQHFQVPDEKNQAKAALIAGKVDVLTLSCMAQPDDGISLFAKLAVEHNPNIRITLQELWIPEDHWPFDAKHRTRKSRDEFDATKIDDLKKTNQAYSKVMEDYVTALNATLGKQYVFIVPDMQATLALREKILAGMAPGLKKQSDLFTDAWGHPSPPLRLLSAYCHYSVIYRRSPVGLPIPPSAAKQGLKDEALNRLLQEIAWDAVTHHPLSGVKADNNGTAG
jgi:hypothetical protein